MNWALSDISGRAPLHASGQESTAHTRETQTFPARAGCFARAHGRPDGVPGRIIGARERAAMRQGRFAMKVRGEMISDVRFEIAGGLVEER